MVKFTFDINNPNSNFKQFRYAVAKAKSDNKEIEFYKLNMEYYLYHFIDCIRFRCYGKMFEDVIKPYLDDVDLLKTVLQSDIIRLKYTSNPKNVINMIPYHEREHPDEMIKIYKELYDWLSRVESEDIKLFVNSLWENSYSHNDWIKSNEEYQL